MNHQRFKGRDNMNTRLRDGLIGGVLLGIVCVIGAYVRSGGTADTNFVFALWYNRVIMGLVVGAPWPKLERKKAMMRGAIFGLVVSFAFFATSGFQDPVSFVAGIVYGVILEAWLSRPEKQ